MSNAFKRWLLCFGLWVLMLNPVSGQTGSRIVHGDGVREMLAMGRVGQYEFNGRSGDVVTVRLLRVSGSWDPAMEVFGADGRLLERQSGNRIQVDRTLSQDGLYSVLVSDVGADESGLYSLAVETLNGSAQFRKQVVDGSVVTDTLQFGGDLAGFSFEGFPGDVVMLRATVLGGVDQEMELFGPDGKRMEKDNPGFFSTTPTLRITRQLDLTGIYKVVISDPDLQGPADFTFSYVLIARAGISTRTIGSVDVRYGDAFVNGFALDEIDQFVFEGRSGDVVNCRATAIRGSVDPVMEIYDPDGVSVAKGGGGIFASGQVQVNYTVLRDGPHKVVVKESRLDQVGDYGFVIERLDGGALHSPVILDGDAKVDVLRFLGDVKGYRLEAQRGDTIAVRVTSIRGNFEPVVELFDANGRLVDKTGGGRGASTDIQLRTAFGDGGIYKILVSDSDADDVGEFTVTLSVVSLAVPQLPLPGLFGLPSIELTNPVVNVVAGQPVMITSRMTDNQGIRRAMLFYRAGGEADFDSLRLGTTDGLTYTGSIPRPVHDSLALDFCGRRTFIGS